MTVAIQSLGTFQFFFSEEDWEGSFNCYGVWRSRVGEAGPYEALHFTDYGTAAFLVPDRTSYDVDGLTLDLLVNRVMEVPITFSGSTPTDVLNAFNNAMPSVLQASQSSAGILVETFEVGHQATILVTESDAWTNLHQTSTYFFGTSAYPALVPDTENYTFVDPAAEEGWYYKTKFCHRGTGEKSAYSIVVPATVNVGIDPGELILGTVYITDPQGKPVRNVLVLLDVPADPTKPGMLATQIKQFTDENGYVEMPVRRGIKAVLSIAGTSVSREIQTPSTGVTFSLDDDSLSTQPDAYAVQVPDVRVGERRSM